MPERAGGKGRIFLCVRRMDAVVSKSRCMGRYTSEGLWIVIKMKNEPGREYFDQEKDV